MIGWPSKKFHRPKRNGQAESFLEKQRKRVRENGEKKPIFSTNNLLTIFTCLALTRRSKKQ